MTLLGEVLRLSKDPVRVENPQVAKLISVKLHGQGAVRRSVSDGKAPKPFTGNRGRAGQFVFSRIWARRGAMALIPDELDGVVVTNEFPLFNVDETRLNSKYLNHYVQTPSFLTELERVSAGASGQNRVKEGVFLDLSIPLPPLDEQCRIAAVLDHAYALRSKRSQVLAHLDTLTQSIFLDTFGDSLSNPKGWPMRSLGGEARSMQYGPRFYNESYSDDGIRIVRITDLNQSGRLDFDRMPRMAVTDDERLRYGLSPGDIVFARTGATVGKLAVIRESDPPCIAGAYFIRISLGDDVRPDYVATALRSRSIQSIIWARSHQSAQQNFSGPGLRALPLPVPPVDLQREFATWIARIDKLRAAVVRAKVADDELFASLQSRAFRGEL